MSERENGSHHEEPDAPPQVGSILQQAREVAYKVAARAREGVRAQIDGQRQGLADGLTQMERAVEQAADSLHQTGHDTIAGYVDRAVRVLHGSAVWVSTHTLEEVGHDLERQVRERPLLFMAGFFALGFLSARVLRSSGSKKP